MKKLLTFLMVFVLSVGVVLPSVVASAHCNEYRNKHYETLEEIDELKRLLTEDGYIPLTKDTQGYDSLLNEPNFWYSGIMDEYNKKYYTLYINKRDLDDYLAKKEDAYTYLLANAVLVSTYQIEVINEGDVEGFMDDDIPEGWKYGLLTFQVTENDFTSDVRIGLYDTDRYLNYTYILQRDNKWNVTHAVPTGHYVIQTITANKNSIVDIEPSYLSDGFFIGEEGAMNIDFTVLNKNKNKGNISQNNSDITSDDDLGEDKLINSSDNNNQSPNRLSEDNSNTKTWILIVEIALIVVFVGVLVIVFMHLKKKRGDKDNTF